MRKSNIHSLQRLVGNRTAFPASRIPNNDAHVEYQQQTSHIIARRCRSLRVTFGNFAAPIGRPPITVPAGSALTLKVGAKVGAPQNRGYVGLWENGIDTVVIPPGEMRTVTLPQDIVFDKPGRLYVTAFGRYEDPPSVWPAAPVAGYDWGCHFESGYSRALTDKTELPWASGARAPYAVGAPLSITGEDDDIFGPLRCAIIADSIGSVGAGGKPKHYNPDNGGSLTCFGFVQDGLGFEMPWLLYGHGGLHLRSLMNPFSPLIVDTLSVARPDVIIAVIGTNDILSDITPVILLEYFERIRMVSYVLNCNFYVATIPPRTNSDNTQRPSTPFKMDPWALRREVNDGLRARFPRIFDLAALWSDPEQPDLWRTDLGVPTLDGAHPSDELHTLAAREFRAFLRTIGRLPLRN